MQIPRKKTLSPRKLARGVARNACRAAGIKLRKDGWFSENWRTQAMLGVINARRRKYGRK